MESDNYTTIQDVPKPNMTWLIGRTIINVEKADYSWCFILDDGSTISTESAWRLVTVNGIAVTSVDHDHTFGLPASVNAAERVAKTVAQSPVSGFELRERTGDLVLALSNNASIEFLNLSCGYESWRTVHGEQEVICMGGGGFTEIGRS